MSDYPEDDDLERLKTWDYSDPLGWFAFAKSIGNYWPDELFGWYETDGSGGPLLNRPVRWFEISTGGWSGNEDILGAMQENAVLWLMTWQSTRRGGHYVFEVPT